MITMGVMALLMAAFMFVMGLIILDSLLLDTADLSGTVHNLTLTTVDEVGEYVNHSGWCGFHSMTVLNMWNATSNQTGVESDEWNSNNWTANSRSGLIQFTGLHTNINNTNWNVTYTYSYGASEACEATNSTIGGVGRFGDYVDLMVLAIIIAVIISLVIIAFANRRVR